MTSAERLAALEAEIEAYTDRLVADAPPFSAAQKVRLRNILAPATTSATSARSHKAA